MAQLSAGRPLALAWRMWSLVLIVILASAPLQAGEDEDLLDLGNGGLVLSATTQYGGRWNAQALVDGSNLTGWSSAKGYPYPNEFLIELPRKCVLASFVVDNTGAEESNFPGISTRHFALYGSATSKYEVVDLLLSGEAEKGKRKVFTIEKPTEVRWLKLVILSNWGNPSHTQLMELEGYGEPLDAPPQKKPIQGIYSSNYGLMRLEQNGTYVVGCYEADNGLLSGRTNGRLLKFRWWEDGPNAGTAFMVLSTDGDHLNGLWYERGLMKGSWYGSRVTDRQGPNCEVPVLDALFKSIYGSDLSVPMEEIGREESPEKQGAPAVLPEIYFASDSAEITPEAEKRLEKCWAVIQSHPYEKIVIKGHTDSTHSQEYNLELSLRRAQAVAEWLIEQGLDGNQLKSEPYGESRPVADNSTVEGRALNRRVEIFLQ
ncbi:MAG: OmpA family protein [Deltaproteobacteria bacterium]|nr:OmpA family protein [Deltaproteobacteria bacterium]